MKWRGILNADEKELFKVVSQRSFERASRNTKELAANK